MQSHGQRHRVARLMAVAVLMLPSAAAAQGGTVTIWDGVYTAEQAGRGSVTFDGTCARCHNPELTGSDRGPALKGDAFVSNWENDSLERVFNKIRDEMPPLGPNTLSDDIKIDILAYILHRNDLPTGTADLTSASAALEGIQVTRKGIWNGVYTEAQAARGRTTFDTACVRCHGADLAGTTAPALKGDAFMANWETGSLNSLFTKIRDTMPPNFGTILEPEAKLDIVAYILQTNAFPPGAEELTTEVNALDAVQILRRGAAPVIPNFALVQVVGCLAEGPAQAQNRPWILTNTSAPAVARDPGSTPEEAKRAASRSLGADTYTLVSVTPFAPADRRGHKVEAKGLLYRETDDNRLNLTSLETVAERCEAASNE